MNRRQASTFFFVGSFLALAAAAANGCSASKGSGAANGLGGNGAGGNGPGPGSGGAGNHKGSGGNGTGGFVIPDGGKDANDDVVHNPCGTQCGDTELCDDAHLGLDDNCDGNVDEGCHCTPGQAHFCFKGDPSYRGTEGCFDGVEKCTEQGIWGPCVGGVHAVPPDNCQNGSSAGCHAITSPPFADVDLKTGTGTFSGNADPGSESWTVTCPAGVNPCPVPGPNPPSDYKPLQSGQYNVTYHKTVNNQPASCDYPLFVGAPGLRVELTWEHPVQSGVDVDLHMHQPMDTNPWAISGVENDCGYGNCKAYSFAQSPQQANSPHWFLDGNMVPNPVNWDNDPDPNKNTCYFAPNGYGTTWQNWGMGCHNPRLDTDDITCDPSVMDPTNGSFCAPENINIDYPPTDQWIRVAVHYYSSHGLSYSIHPEVKIYCDGALAADLGPLGYSNSPLTFTSGEGSQTYSGNVFWLVGDVLFKPATQCTAQQCVVQPLYGDPNSMTAYTELDTGGNPAFGPAYPPIPQ
ncbi:MAG TPA: hypothetical protein VHB21_19335 [Minicystis sp.]|nr:hypothetical protein [Minicystis sp.]